MRKIAHALWIKKGKVVRKKEIVGALMVTMLFFVSSAVYATTLYRVPLAFAPWPINAWRDDGSLPNANLRYDGFVIPSNSPYNTIPN